MTEKYWHTDRGFTNPEGNPTPRGIRFATFRWLFKWLFKKSYKIGVDLPIDHVMERSKALSLFNSMAEPSLTWLGHAVFLLRINGTSILIDPLLFGNPAPAFIPAMARVPNPFLPSDLDVDILLISHEHHDHIHRPSLNSLKNKENIQPVVPLGVNKKIEKHGFKKSIELDWFESHAVNENLSIMAVTSVHYSNFSNSTLWAGFIITYKDKVGKKHKIYFGGDSGYGEFFKRDIAPYGPFDFALIGMGGFYISFPTLAPVVHTSPEQAVQAALDVGANKLIGMHWGTMRLSEEDPTALFPRARAHAPGIGYGGEILQLKIGETISL